MRPVIYQLFVRHFSNFHEGGVPWGSKEQNGCGTFAGVNDAALQALAKMGVTHVWLTGVLRHATRTEYPGLPAAPACVVKGLAGSPYAVSDYFDVDPDLAVQVDNRLEEFRELLVRVRRWGMVPMMDFIPNHVSRAYQSVLRPECDFGRTDDRSRFFARDNAFYYLEPAESGRAMELPEGEFVPERGCGRVTGNNAATWAPDPCDWYETVKLNYGTDYRNGPPAFGSLPREFAAAGDVPQTWRLMDEVIACWQQMGVGGFRCDMAHMVPEEFWRYVIVNSRLRDDGVCFMAEAYNDHMSLCRGDVHESLLAAGFDAVYDSTSYQLMKSMYEGSSWANDLDRCQHDKQVLARCGVRYLENHDEPRLAAPEHWAGQGRAVARALMLAHYGAVSAPVLFYNGQEVGERADGPGGYGGDNGRTSIFDYTCLPRLQHWSHGGKYDGALLTADEAALRAFCVRLLPLLQHPALSKGNFYGLNWANQQTAGFGRLTGETVSGHRAYAFLRHNRKARATVLLVCNFHPNEEMRTRLFIPTDALNWAGRGLQELRMRHLLNPTAPDVLGKCLPGGEGLEVELVMPAGDGVLLEWLP